MSAHVSGSPLKGLETGYHSILSDFTLQSVHEACHPLSVIDGHDPVCVYIRFVKVSITNSD